MQEAQKLERFLLLILTGNIARGKSVIFNISFFYNYCLIVTLIWKFSAVGYQLQRVITSEKCPN